MSITNVGENPLSGWTPPSSLKKPLDHSEFKNVLETIRQQLKDYSLSKITVSVSWYRRWSRNETRLKTHALLDEINEHTTSIWNDKSEIKRILKKGANSHSDKVKAREQVSKHLFSVNKSLEMIKSKQKELQSDHTLKPYIPKKFEENMEKVQVLVKELNRCTHPLHIAPQSPARLPPKPIPTKMRLPPPPVQGLRLDPNRKPIVMPSFHLAPPPIPKAEAGMTAEQMKKAENVFKEWKETTQKNIHQTRTFATFMSDPKKLHQLHSLKLKNLWSLYQDLTHKQAKFNARLNSALAEGKDTKERIEKFNSVLESQESEDLIQALIFYTKEFYAQEKNILTFTSQYAEKVNREGWNARDYLFKPVQALPRLPLLTEPLIKAAPSMAQALTETKDKLYC